MATRDSLDAVLGEDRPPPDLKPSETKGSVIPNGRNHVSVCIFHLQLTKKKRLFFFSAQKGRYEVVVRLCGS